MKDQSKIINFPYERTGASESYEEYPFSEFEDWEPHVELLWTEDYPGLVRYCKQEAERNPKDLYAQANLGDAYIRNGEYEKAMEFLSGHHKKHPWNQDYQQIILDALYALGKTEDDFDWSEEPVILRMSIEIVDACYVFLKTKRKPRYVTELYLEFIPQGYLLFTEEDLLNALEKDKRFIVESPDERPLFARIKVTRKKRK